MKLIAQLKLLPPSDQHAALLQTLEQANVVCNAISQTAWQSQTFKQFDVHTLVYDHIRATAGVRVVLVNPAYTSRTCSACGHCDKRNRKNQAVFCCGVCHFATSADYNAAINSERAVVTLSMASTLRR